MTHSVGIDVSLETSRLCIVDAAGVVVRELTAESDPEALATILLRTGLPFVRVGLEAGPLSQWLHAGLTRAGLPALLIETRRLRAATKAMPVKTDRNDARAIAQVVRTGWFRAVHVKSKSRRNCVVYSAPASCWLARCAISTTPFAACFAVSVSRSAKSANAVLRIAPVNWSRDGRRWR